MDEGDLAQLIIDNPAFEELDDAMDVFCAFDAVGMSRQEVRHGYFLQYILDPARPHGFGAECLRAFMRAVASTLAGEGLCVAPLDVHLMELDGVTVRREYQAIDLLIEVPQEKLVVAIELKIDASEHSGQLGRYREIVERDWPDHRHLMLFLTKRGEAPSNDGVGWHALPLEPVVDAFAAVAKKQIGGEAARIMLSGYVGMLRRNHLTDERLEHLAASLWREHRDALEFLMARRPDNRYAVLALLLARKEEAAKRLSTLTGLKIEIDHSTRSYVRFGISDWDDLPTMRSAEGWTPSRRGMLVEMTERGGVARIQFVLGPCSSRQQIFQALQDAGLDIGGTHGIGKSWRQLANVSFQPDPTDPADMIFDKFVNAIADFIGSHVSGYTTVLNATLSGAGGEASPPN